MLFCDIENIIRFVLCVFSLAICLAAIIVLCRKNRKFQLNTPWIREHRMLVVWTGLLIVLLWGVSWVLMSYNLDYILQKINVYPDSWIKHILALVPELLLLFFLVKIDIYPSLTFRGVPSKQKNENDSKVKQYAQISTQFWNGGVFPLYQVKPELMGIRRGADGNVQQETIPMWDADGTEHIKGILYSQDERAYTWYTKTNYFEPRTRKHAFEKYVLTVTARCKLLGKDIPCSASSEFYPEDIHQGDFVKKDAYKVPQELYTLYNNKEYISPKRLVQRIDIGLRGVQLVLLVVFFGCICGSYCVSHGSASIILEIVQKTTLAILFILFSWRLLLRMPIRSLPTPSYLYGNQQ